VIERIKCVDPRLEDHTLDNLEVLTDVHVELIVRSETDAGVGNIGRDTVGSYLDEVRRRAKSRIDEGL